MQTTNTWTKKSPMPTPRGWVSISVVDGIIYAIGGCLGGNGFSAAVEAYDSVTDT